MLSILFSTRAIPNNPRSFRNGGRNEFRIEIGIIGQRYRLLSALTHGDHGAEQGFLCRFVDVALLDQFDHPRFDHLKRLFEGYLIVEYPGVRTMLTGGLPKLSRLALTPAFTAF